MRTYVLPVSTSGASAAMRNELDEGGRQAVIASTPGLVVLARFGLAMKGLVQLLVAALALAHVFGDSHGRITDAPGALAALARAPSGRPAILLMTTGLFAYAGL